MNFMPEAPPGVDGKGININGQYHLKPILGFLGAQGDNRHPTPIALRKGDDTVVRSHVFLRQLLQEQYPQE